MWVLSLCQENPLPVSQNGDILALQVSVIWLVNVVDVGHQHPIVFKRKYELVIMLIIFWVSMKTQLHVITGTNSSIFHQRGDNFSDNQCNDNTTLQSCSNEITGGSQTLYRTVTLIRCQYCKRVTPTVGMWIKFDPFRLHLSCSPRMVTCNMSSRGACSCVHLSLCWLKRT